MQFIQEETTSTTVVTRSKFITHLVPIEAFDGLQSKLKTEHPKANHVVYALRSINEYDQIVENSSDDGEPKGCAGVPALNVLRGLELVNCAVLIVRYFGGIKLGTGGMARAYAQATKDVISISDLSVYKKQISYTFTTSYSQVDRTLYQLKQLDITQYKRDFLSEGVSWEIVVSEEQLERYLITMLQE